MIGIFFLHDMILGVWTYFGFSQIQLSFSDWLTIVGVIISSVLAIILYHFQDTATTKLIKRQKDVNKVNHALNLLTEREINIYDTISPFVTDCYENAKNLHPLRAAQNPINFQEKKEEYYKWFIDQYTDSRKKAHEILLLAETNKDFLPKDIIEALDKFGNVCEDHAILYYEIYGKNIPELREERLFMSKQQERCYSENKIIEETYQTYRELVQKRISQLKCVES